MVSHNYVAVVPNLEDYPQSVINRMPFSFAIYDDNGYKCDAIATKYEESAKAVLCTLRYTKGEVVIRTGDKASTKP